MPARIPYSHQRPMPATSACSPNGPCQPKLRTRPAADASHECMFVHRPMPAKIMYASHECMFAQRPMPTRFAYSRQRPMPATSACPPSGRYKPELRTRTSGRCQPRVYVRQAADASQNYLFASQNYALAPGGDASDEHVLARRTMPAKIICMLGGRCQQ